MASVILASYPLQDKPEAVKHRDRLRGEGKKAYLTIELDGRRYGGLVHVHAEIKGDVSGRAQDGLSG